MTLRGLLYLLPLLSLFTILSGCDRQSQYAILTTVFTGVPPMEELYGDNLPEEKAKPENLVAEPREIMYQHPLWEASQCMACHEAVADVEMSEVESVGSEGQDSIPVKNMVSGLIQPADKLCIKCHLDKTARRAIRERLWLHNSVARGNCIACHAEHQSTNLAQLRQSPSKICAVCHESNTLPTECIAGPSDDLNKNKCLSCHNTHVGRNRFLLSRDYTEVKIPAESWEAPALQSE